MAYLTATEVDGNLDMNATDPWVEAIALASKPASQYQFDFADLAGTVFFEITNTNPDKRSNIKFQHLDEWSDRISVVRRRVNSHQEGGCL